MSLYMPVCVRNSHYVTVVLNKYVNGETQCYVLDSTGRENFFLAGRNKTVELLYAYIETTALRINPISNDPTETDVERMWDIQKELKKASSLPLTTAVTMKISALARELELLKTGLRSEINWLEGIEQDGSFECGLAVAGNIALERTTKAGLLPVENFIEI